MFKQLLVPLDGSALAEVVLPVAAYLAQTLGAKVMLLHVVERNAPPTVHGERHLTNLVEAKAYLTEVTRRAFPADVPVEQHVHTGELGDMAHTIAAHIDEMKADLIVMCAHGQGGLKRMIVGRIAQQVVACGSAPVLLIQPDPTGNSPAFACRRLLVPLDGDPAHEHGLMVATDLAQACEASLYLLTVIPTLGTLPAERAAAGKLLPAATAALLDLSQQEADNYMERWTTQLRAGGLTMNSQVGRGAPANIIVQTARQVSANLIVLGTHGKKGLAAFWADSVAARVISQTRLPMLLVPVGDAG